MGKLKKLSETLLDFLKGNLLNDCKNSAVHKNFGLNMLLTENRNLFFI